MKTVEGKEFRNPSIEVKGQYNLSEKGAEDRLALSKSGHNIRVRFEKAASCFMREFNKYLVKYIELKSKCEKLKYGNENLSRKPRVVSYHNINPKLEAENKNLRERNKMLENQVRQIKKDMDTLTIKDLKARNVRNILYLAGEPRKCPIGDKMFYKTMICRGVAGQMMELMADISGDTAEKSKELADFVARACTNQEKYE